MNNQMTTKSNTGAGKLMLCIALFVTLLLGCDEPMTDSYVEADEITTSKNLSSELSNLIAAQNRDIQNNLNLLRRSTAPYHNLNKAKADNYEPLTPCWYHSELGAMGYHYVNMEYFNNGEVNLLQPEALMYEPGPGGHYQLVGLEYIVRMDLWEEERAPVLMGQAYHANDTLGLYTLHIWLWKYNPTGIFSNWNPRVSCEYSEESEDRAGL